MGDASIFRDMAKFDLYLTHSKGYTDHCGHKLDTPPRELLVENPHFRRVIIKLIKVPCSPIILGIGVKVGGGWGCTDN